MEQMGARVVAHRAGAPDGLHQRPHPLADRDAPVERPPVDDEPPDRALATDERRAIEAEVRSVVREDLPVTARYMPYQEAIEGGADAFFDEKYTETVRTVRVEGYPSFELCGGTHCRASGQVGGFVITSDRSIGSGMRRIEALTGDAADAWSDAHRTTVEDAAERAGAQTPNSLPGRIDELQTRIKDLEKRLRAGVAGGVPRPADTAKGAAVISGVPSRQRSGAWSARTCP